MCPTRFRAKAGHGARSAIDAGPRQESASNKKPRFCFQIRTEALAVYGLILNRRIRRRRRRSAAPWWSRAAGIAERDDAAHAGRDARKDRGPVWIAARPGR